MARLYAVIGMLALSVLAWADYRGVGLFDDLAQSQPNRLNPSQRSTFHK
jgi:hypothetical protein